MNQIEAFEAYKEYVKTLPPPDLNYKRLAEEFVVRMQREALMEETGWTDAQVALYAISKASWECGSHILGIKSLLDDEAKFQIEVQEEIKELCNV
jgi:hypothetical protein